MDPVRETVEVIGRSVTVRLPDSFTARRVEVIILPAAESTAGVDPVHRRPAPGMAGTVLKDDLIAPASAVDEWDVLK